MHKITSKKLLEAKILRILEALKALRRISTIPMLICSITAVNILMLKRVQFILGRDTTIQVRVDLLAGILSPVEEISKYAHDKSLPSSERRRFQTEEKVR